MPRGLAIAALTCAGVLLGPAGARAWTDAAVRNVHARVDLEPDGTAYVTLRLTVRVHGGWLEGLELNGLDEDLVLDEASPPVAETHDGRELSPTVRVLRGGRVQLGFRRRSPRRGVLIVTLAYYTSLAHRLTEPLEDSPRVRVSWVLPGWSSGLDGPEIEVHAPEGSRLVGDPSDSQESGLERSVEPEGEQTVLRWRRAHLPRTVPWRVSIDVPEEALDQALRGAPIVELPPPASVTSEARDPWPLWVGFAIWLALIAWLKLYAVRRHARRSRSAPRPLIPSPTALRVVAIGGLAATAAYAARLTPWAALACLALLALLAAHRAARATPPSKLGAWRVVDARWLFAARRHAWVRWVEPSSWVDATTPLGALHLAAALAAPWLLFEGAVAPGASLLLSVAALPAFLSGTRLSFPRSATESLWRLMRLCRRLDEVPDGVALRPVMHISTDGELQDARVRTVLGHRPDGLLRLDLAMGELPHAGGTDAVPMLLLLTRQGRPLEALLQERFSQLTRVESPGGRRVLRAIVVRDGDLGWLGELLAAFADCPAAPSHARGTPTVAQTIQELPPPMAVGF